MNNNLNVDDKIITRVQAENPPPPPLYIQLLESIKQGTITTMNRPPETNLPDTLHVKRFNDTQLSKHHIDLPIHTVIEEKVLHWRRQLLGQATGGGYKTRRKYKKSRRSKKYKNKKH